MQVQVLASKPGKLSGLIATRAESDMVAGHWSDNNLRTAYDAPILVRDGSAARRRFETAFDEFRALFPSAVCYPKIVPTDEPVTLTLFYREDEQLKRLMLDDAQIKSLDRMWDELRFVSESPLKQVDAFESVFQFATQDANPAVFEPMREPIRRDAEAFKKRKIEAEPKHVQAALEFARRAWRRPLSEVEESGLRGLYQSLRNRGMPHAAAVRMVLARVLVAPQFLYRGEKAAPGPKAAPVNDWELATRLSYFLWSSLPDDELAELASTGKLHETDVLLAQTRRMLKDAKVRRLATEFGCEWLHVRDLETLDEKSERHFPTFLSLQPVCALRAGRGGAILFGFVPRGSLGAVAARRRLQFHERRPCETLWHRVENRRLAASRRPARQGPRRHPCVCQHAGEAKRRLAHQPDSARQLAQRSCSWRQTAASAQGRSHLAG